MDGYHSPQIDVDAVGLGDLGRREGYVERQLKRWLKQFEASTQRELPVVYELHEKLSKNVPIQQGVGLCHGDYRFDNTVMGADFRVLAVLDWELCTLGDPMADVGYLMNNWAEPGERGPGGRGVFKEQLLSFPGGEFCARSENSVHGLLQHHFDGFARQTFG